mmetsp:Transcript_27727/g.86263  ORF Transcript_27727/g.86263 Transcript_27727/m.86263 type:complete len:251 (+) Transcript_27727:105-857(+)|eukprot:CAMPEP_0204590016 /NCGR_PEP_ID=MMETSP0661-20131031/49545_1 /ASSEMBLY_ACC=CAM_ASM_000606 /TAXON_ID=109239 /ORGANISM="Alexandrium margalefi, Strain AMGDE01CS-322" /LENGTH=250 /DNA_ID=CAMNT_0051600005 /DNA_START=103 /DNA_END=855 /DNA_ORIENTATION=+
MAGSASLLSVGENCDPSSEESSSLLPASRDRAPAPHPIREGRLVWRLAVAGAVALVLLGAASVGVLPRRPAHSAPAPISAKGLERKYYDDSGAYWQAPGRGISASELWGSCEHAHMHGCGGFCCCDEGYYWTSPKTVVRQGKALIKKAAMGAVGEKSHGLPDTAEKVAKEAAEALGKAVVDSVISKDQHCVPQETVPTGIVETLSDGKRIPGSDVWVACSTFTSNSHTCGRYCCCNGGFQWSAPHAACIS